MIRTLASCSFLIGCLNCYSQPVTVQPSAVPDIEIIGPQSPDYAAFVAQIVGAEQPAGLKDWRPYGVVIRNHSSQSPAAMAVSWTGAFQGMPPGFGGADMTPDWFLGPARRVKPGQAVLAVPMSVIEEPRDLQAYSDGKRSGNLANYQRAANVEISLAGVVFESGQFVGPNQRHEYEQWKAKLDAPRCVAETILEKKGNGSISELVEWLQMVASGPSRPDADANALQTGLIARSMLRIYRQEGEAAAHSIAQNTLRRLVFPLHR